MPTFLPSRLPETLVTPYVDALMGFILGYAPKHDEVPIEDYLDMAQNDSAIGMAIQARNLITFFMMQEYKHPDETIQQEVRESIVNMRGSWRKSLVRMFSYVPFGHSFTEKAYDVTTGTAMLRELRTLDPRRFDYQGSFGGIDKVIYHGAMGDIEIPYQDGMHLTNLPELVLDNNPHGLACCRRALNYWRAHKLVLAEMAIAAQRQATPILVGKTDTAVETVLLNSNGEPLIDPATGNAISINQGYSFRQQLEKLRNNSVIVLDRLDELEAVHQEADAEFFISILHYLSTRRLESFLIPETFLSGSRTGSGDSNLSKAHLEHFKMVCETEAYGVSEVLIENLIRPMIVFNHGEQAAGYGTFPIRVNDSNALELLEVLTLAVGRGLFSAEDLAVVNKARKLIGLEESDQVFATQPEPAFAGNDEI